MATRFFSANNFFIAIVASLTLIAGCGQRVDINLAEMRHEQESIIRALEVKRYEVMPAMVKRENVMLEALIYEPDVSLASLRIVSAMDANGYYHKQVQISGNGDYLLFCHKKDSYRYAKWMIGNKEKFGGLILRADGAEMFPRECSG